MPLSNDYNPELDDLKYSQRDVDGMVNEVVDRVFKEVSRRCFVAGVEQALAGAAALPLSIEGRWKPDTVYQPGALVYLAGEQWIAKAATASKPAADNALWRRVNLPNITENDTSRASDRERR